MSEQVTHADGHVADAASNDGLDFDLVRPDPAGTITSLGSLGYTPEAAIADLVDNSIAASATQIDIVFRWGGASGSTVAVIDNGRGMTEEELRSGMAVGGRSGHKDRHAGDLGRFGMGLKTASFSQARELVVATRTPSGPWFIRTWDVDHVLAVRDWQLLIGPPEGARPQLSAIIADMTSGTVVLWRQLTRMAAAGSTSADEWAQREFYSQVETIEKHLGMVFSRYITHRIRPIRLTVNRHVVQPWDPFLESNRYVDRLAPESPVQGVTVQGFILPHRSRLSDKEYEAAGGPRGWLDQQGFYVYRQDRLIVAGDWLKLGFRKDDKHVLARLAVDVSTAHDGDWGIDVRKSTTTPPPSLVSHLRRLAKATRQRASAVVTHKGKVVRDRQTASDDVTWRVMTRFGRTQFRINRDHPLIRDVLDRSPDARPAIRALLHMVEETLPVALIRVTPGSETGPATADEEDTPEEVLEMSRRVLDAVIGRGDPPSEALERVLRMPPFDEYPALRLALSNSPDSAAIGPDENYAYGGN